MTARSRQLLPMVAAMRAAGASVGYAVYRGGHDWQVWHAHLDQMLVLASRDTSRPARARDLGPRRHAAPAVHRRLHQQRRHARRRSCAASTRGRHHGSSPPGRGRGFTVRARLSRDRLLGGLILALVSAAAINLGFLLQQRGLRDRAIGRQGRAAYVRSLLRSRTWLGGQALGWLGFGAQIVAVSIAPLSLVQAFAAGGLALSLPLAAGLFGYRISRAQVLAVLLVSAGLAVLPIGVRASADRLHTGVLLAAVAAVMAVGLPVARARAPVLRAIAAGLFYGVADAAIKAASVAAGHHPGGASIAGWIALAALTTFAGFLAFQSALRGGGAIAGISLMNGVAALAALSFGAARVPRVSRRQPAGGVPATCWLSGSCSAASPCSRPRRRSSRTPGMMLAASPSKR